MQNQDQIAFFKKNGYLLIENMLSPLEIDIIRNQIPKVSQEGVGVIYEEKPQSLQSSKSIKKDNNILTDVDSECGVIYEEKPQVLRSLNGVQKDSEILTELCCHPKLLVLAEKILESQVYVHQFKINLKKGFEGDVWEWHQDHIFWLKEDGMLKPDAFTVAIFLTESNEFNAPIMLVPGSHLAGTVNVPADSDDDDWQSNFMVRTKYPAPKQFIREQVAKNGMFAAKAKPGSVLIFHSDTLHCSTKNMSPYDREVILISYNSVNNTLQNTDNPRPEFLASRDYTPLKPITKSAYFQISAKD